LPVRQESGLPKRPPVLFSSCGRPEGSSATARSPARRRVDPHRPCAQERASHEEPIAPGTLAIGLAAAPLQAQPVPEVCSKKNGFLTFNGSDGAFCHAHVEGEMCFMVLCGPLVSDPWRWQDGRNATSRTRADLDPIQT
jgi:hypothetical protein